MKSAPARLIKAALVWDVPLLRVSKHKGATLFVESMSGFLTPEAAAFQEPLDSLGVAALGVCLDYSGDSARAGLEYRRLVEVKNRPTKLLGLCLLVWSSDELAVVDVRRASRLVASEPDPVLRSHLYSKLALAALDGGRWELAGEMLRAGRDASPPGSQLEAALNIEGINYLGWPLSSQSLEPAERDDLVEYPWITSRAGAAARQSVIDAVIARSRSPLSITFSFGRRIVDDVAVAEAQANWAGALWLRRPIQLQLAAQLLSSDAPTPSEAAWAVVYWSIGGGTSVTRIVDLAEPHFDSEAANMACDELLKRYAGRPNGFLWLAEAGLGLWDLVEEERLRCLLLACPVQDSDHPQADQCARLWALGAARLGDHWEGRLQELGSAQLLSVLGQMPLAAIDRLSDQMATTLFNIGTREARNSDTAPPWIGQTWGGLGERLGAPIDPGERAGWGPYTTVDVASGWTAARPFLAGAIPRLVEDVTEMIQEARKGYWGLGTHDPLVTLARALLLSGEVQPWVRNKLVEWSADEAAPSDIRLRAVEALAALAESGMSVDLNGEHIAEIPEGGSASPIRDVSQDELRAAKTRLRAAVEPTTEVAGDIVRLSRHPDAKVRRAAVLAATGFLAQRRGLAVEGAVLGALYDPEPEVVLAALAAVQSRGARMKLVRRACGDRMKQLMTTARRDVRAAVAHALDGAEPISVRNELRELVSSDRSWVVRNALKGFSEPASEATTPT